MDRGDSPKDILPGVYSSGNPLVFSFSSFIRSRHTGLTNFVLSSASKMFDGRVPRPFYTRREVKPPLFVVEIIWTVVLSPV